MSETSTTESRSSVAISMTAKGEAQVAVKVYATDDDVAAAARTAAETLASVNADLTQRGVKIAVGQS